MDGATSLPPLSGVMLTNTHANLSAGIKYSFFSKKTSQFVSLSNHYKTHLKKIYLKMYVPTLTLNNGRSMPGFALGTLYVSIFKLQFD